MHVLVDGYNIFSIIEELLFALNLNRYLLSSPPKLFSFEKPLLKICCFARKQKSEEFDESILCQLTLNNINCVQLSIRASVSDSQR